MIQKLCVQLVVAERFQKTLHCAAIALRTDRLILSGAVVLLTTFDLSFVPYVISCAGGEYNFIRGIEKLQ